MKLTVRDFMLVLGVTCRADISKTQSYYGIVTGPKDGGILIDEMWMDCEYVKPFLRHISSLTEDDAKTLYAAAYGKLWSKRASCLTTWWNLKIISIKEPWLGNPNIWRKLLEMGVDIFGWIESGAALDAAKIETT